MPTTSRSAWPELLTPDTVGGHLVARGLADAPAAVTARALGGGISNVVLAVDAPGLRAVVKQALPRLRVEEEWLAKRERALTEAEALRLAAHLTLGAVPPMLDADAETCAIVIGRAPDDWRTWKDLLLDGEADPAVSRALGTLLATWHRETEGDSTIARRFADHDAFDQLRVDPYHRAVAHRWPHLASRIDAYAEQLSRARACLVHGDFSPKNVLVGADGRWVIDFEVAHVGDPVFDLAFLLNHLILKSVHRPAARPAYEACGQAFLEAYRGAAGWRLAFDPRYLYGQVGCLLLARVDGKSPAEYLTDVERLVARSAGTRLLLDPPASLDGAFAALEG